MAGPLGGRATGIAPDPNTRAALIAALMRQLGTEAPLPSAPPPTRGPTVRAPTTPERVSQAIRRAYGAVADQPVMRAADALGVTGIGGVARGEEPEVRGAAVTPVRGLPRGATHLDEAADAAQKGIRAFHGSPHDFDRFDLSKIGTGEGAQAYGHGLYFAGKEDTAKQYRNALSNPKIEVGGTRVTPSGTADDIAAAWLEEGHLKRASGLTGLNPQTYAREGIQALIERGAGSPGVSENLRRALTTLDHWEQRGLSLGQGGHMYEVNIAADPAALLDWDAPLTRQSPQVQEALKKLGITPESAATRNPMLASLRAQHGTGMTGSDAYQAARALAGEHPVMSSGAGASARLREAGIPGIKYRDQLSRGRTPAMELISGRPNTHNYSINDDSIISILRKYGLLAGAGAGAATQRDALLQQLQGDGAQ